MTLTRLSPRRRGRDVEARPLRPPPAARAGERAGPRHAWPTPAYYDCSLRRAVRTRGLLGWSAEAQGLSREEHLHLRFLAFVILAHFIRLRSNASRSARSSQGTEWISHRGCRSSRCRSVVPERAGLSEPEDSLLMTSKQAPQHVQAKGSPRSNHDWLRPTF